MKKQHKYYSLLLFLAATLFCVACSEDEYKVPQGGTDLQNDCIKRTLGPNLAGSVIEFAYAMALPPEKGKLVSAQVSASIAGATGTYLEHNSYYTSGGYDVGVEVGFPSITDGQLTEVVYTKDTCAATLRYYYVIPEEAKGKQVSFTFSAEDSKGKKVSYKMGPYQISDMDMKLDMVVTDNSCISIADMEVYPLEDTSVSADKKDLIYLYRRLDNVDFLHSLVAPGADADYLPGVTLPAGVTNNTSLWKIYGATDQHLARNQYGVFIDDLDFQKIDLSNAPDFAINLKKDAGVWVETADGRYRAYIYVNDVNNVKKEMTVSMKRLKVK